QAQVLARLAEWEVSGAWAEGGAPSPVAWLVHRASITTHRAAGLVRSARLLRAHERTAKALDAGDVSTHPTRTQARPRRGRWLSAGPTPWSPSAKGAGGGECSSTPWSTSRRSPGTR
ncbi:MAG: hypothetical protein R6X23_04215, partial [Acidimicrobiia bacterium]